MRAVKDNKVYNIDETQKQGYIDAGYDIVGDDDKIIAHGRGKSVSHEQYEAAMARIAELEAAQESAEKPEDAEKVEKPEKANRSDKTDK